MTNLPISDHYRAGQVGKRLLKRAMAGIYRVQGDAACRRLRDREAAGWYRKAFARRSVAPAPLFLALRSAVEAVGRRSSRTVPPSPSADAARTPEE